MADQNVKISQLTTITGAAAAGTDLIPIVDSSNTKAITFNELKNYLTNQGLGANVTNQQYTTTVTGTAGAGDFYEKRYLRSNSAPSAPSNTPYPPSLWSTSVPAGNQVLWSITGLIKGDKSGLETGTNWSTPTREGTGQVIFYRDNTGTAPYNGSGGPTDTYIQDGDIWYDTKDNNKIYYYDHTQSPKWVGVFTPFPGIDTSGNVTGIQKATGLKSGFAIVADQFQLVNTGQTGTTANVPFEMDGNNVFIKSAHIRNLDAGVIIGGEITAAISLTSPKILAGKLNTSSVVYNPDSDVYTMPAFGWGRHEAGSGTSAIYSITKGPGNADGDPDWLSGDCTFYGWTNGIPGPGYYVKRFGNPTTIFNYSFEGYASDNTNGINFNIIYQVDGGDIQQAQFPQADTVGGGLRLSQHGSVIITGLTGGSTVKWGWRAASITKRGSITYGQLTVTCFNI